MKNNNHNDDGDNAIFNVNEFYFRLLTDLLKQTAIAERASERTKIDLRIIIKIQH